MQNVEKVMQTQVLKVYDADIDKVVEITAEMQLRAVNAFQQLHGGFFIVANTIKRIYDEKLYLAHGIQSRDQFLSTLGFIGRRQAYTLLAVASKFENVFKERMIGENSEELKTRFEGVGIQKLYEIMTLDDDEIISLGEGKEITVGDKSLNLEDIKGTAYRELEKQFKNAKKKLSDDLSFISEENKILKEEIKIKNKQIENADQKLDKAKELEIKFGGTAKALEHKDFLLKECFDKLNEFNDFIIKANIKPNDPERLQKSLVDLIKKMNTTSEIVNEHYQEITAEF